ncbi:hypothetical protein CMK12_00195 [Candidatus Poribacteria bacterium]|nr:hypothetical protein [Candidatus Poribacteria bacterium]
MCDLKGEHPLGVWGSYPGTVKGWVKQTLDPANKKKQVKMQTKLEVFYLNKNKNAKKKKKYSVKNK